VNGSNGIAAGEPGTYTAEVELPLAELKFPSDLIYVFPFQFEGRCVDFVVISRERLDDLRLNKDVGSEYVSHRVRRRPAAVHPARRGRREPEW
jgi:hypothetical protein